MRRFLRVGLVFAIRFLKNKHYGSEYVKWVKGVTSIEIR